MWSGTLLGSNFGLLLEAIVVDSGNKLSTGGSGFILAKQTRAFFITHTYREELFPCRAPPV